MPRKHQFLTAEFSQQWQRSYAKLQMQQQHGTDKVVMALIKGEPTPGMRIKPLEPDKYYNEARCTDAGRMIQRIANGIVLFVDIISHDEIAAYGRRR